MLVNRNGPINIMHSDGPTIHSKSHMKLSDGPTRVSEYISRLYNSLIMHLEDSISFIMTLSGT